MKRDGSLVGWFCQRLAVFALFPGLVSAFVVAAHGQVDCVEPRIISAANIQGQIFDPSGISIPEASVTILREDKEVTKLKTDKEGRFYVESREGIYRLKISAPGFEASQFRVRVRRHSLGLQRSPTIRILLGLPSLNCAWATTREKEFRREVRNNNERMQRNIQDNATQK